MEKCDPNTHCPLIPNATHKNQDKEVDYLAAGMWPQYTRNYRYGTPLDDHCPKVFLTCTSSNHSAGQSNLAFRRSLSEEWTKFSTLVRSPLHAPASTSAQQAFASLRSKPVSANTNP